MAVSQGCVEVTAQTVQAAEITVPAGTTPDHAVAAIHQGQAWPERERKVLSGSVRIDGTDLKILTRGLRSGDCICWTAYTGS